MRLFNCPVCGERLFFDNLICRCGLPVAFDPERQTFVGDAGFCTNRQLINCNWTSTVDPDGYCRACRMTEMVPDTFHSDNLTLWAESELAKRWVLANLSRWGWLTGDDNGPHPVFHLLGEATREGEREVSMGHSNGLVTINVVEADIVERIRRREQFDEPLRTMIGHFRHELGHFFFERLAHDPEFVESFRSLFGNEQEDYGEALGRYYAEGPTDNWEGSHISAYASSHPHEDWAESFAHLLHLTDIVDSFLATGFSGSSLPGQDYDAYLETDPMKLLDFGMQIGVGLNHVNRAMGLSDIYPFTHSPTIADKLSFVHKWISTSR